MPSGISIGLGYNSIGGSILFIETAKSSFREPPKDKEHTQEGKLMFTGSLGDVMKESIQIAYTLAKNFCYEIYDNKYLEVKKT